jgi:hypothetical protein
MITPETPLTDSQSTCRKRFWHDWKEHWKTLEEGHVVFEAVKTKLQGIYYKQGQAMELLACLCL